MSFEKISLPFALRSPQPKFERRVFFICLAVELPPQPGFE